MKKSEFNKEKIFPSKLILFGEYTVLLGGKALALPYNNYFSHWKEGKSFEHPELGTFIRSLSTDFPEFSFDLDQWTSIAKDHYFYSTIPQGYGLGSSGALVASIYDGFVDTDQNFTNNPHLIKRFLGAIESYFHGKSSGIDPLVCLIQKPLLLEGEDIFQVDVDEEITNCFTLVDSHTPRNNKNAIHHFLQQYDENVLFKKNINMLVECNNIAIEHLIANNKEALMETLKKISKIQLENMGAWITPSIMSLWKENTDPNTSYKICGGGGGGYYFKFHFK
jgi:mevalonate kinase